MKERLRIVVSVIVALFAVAWCGSYVVAEEHARRRGEGGRERTQARGRRDSPPPQARQQHQEQRRERAQSYGAQQRHPRPDGRYDRGRSGGQRNYDRYHWRNYGQRQRLDRYRFPRHYNGRGVFAGTYYRGHAFGPHYRLSYYGRSAWRAYYWPYPYAPSYACGWYSVPTDRQLVYDPESGQEYWEYSSYEYLNLCFQ